MEEEEDGNDDDDDDHGIAATTTTATTATIIITTFLIIAAECSDTTRISMVSNLKDAAYPRSIKGVFSYFSRERESNVVND
mmetsp:Transcript_15807/g.34635  ORF Transcript_15807/g.34635 Transcript_15807/m.34635 type:complete len:81 (+) Transcript_15807:594-836(+)